MSNLSETETLPLTPGVSVTITTVSWADIWRETKHKIGEWNEQVHEDTSKISEVERADREEIMELTMDAIVADTNDPDLDNPTYRDRVRRYIREYRFGKV